jgi:hypothetical protein
MWPPFPGEFAALHHIFSDNCFAGPYFPTNGFAERKNTKYKIKDERLKIKTGIYNPNRFTEKVNAINCRLSYGETCKPFFPYLWGRFKICHSSYGSSL